MTPKPNLCARCGGAMSQDEEDAAADRGESLLDQICFCCWFDQADSDLDQSRVELRDDSEPMPKRGRKALRDAKATEASELEQVGDVRSCVKSRTARPFSVTK